MTNTPLRDGVSRRIFARGSIRPDPPRTQNFSTARRRRPSKEPTIKHVIARRPVSVNNLNNPKKGILGPAYPCHQLVTGLKEWTVFESKTRSIFLGGGQRKRCGSPPIWRATRESHGTSRKSDQTFIYAGPSLLLRACLYEVVYVFVVLACRRLQCWLLSRLLMNICATRRQSISTWLGQTIL